VVSGAASATMVGYDGRVYLTILATQNSVSVRVGDKTCVATFAFARSRKQARTTIGPVVCRARN
jgi:outer membrane usher protein FimD/PapC